MNSAEFQFLSIHWLWLLLPFWAYLTWWFRTKQTHHGSSMVDIDLSAQNHFYHPQADSLLAQSKVNKTLNSQQRFWKIPAFWFQGFAISAMLISLADPVLIGERLPDPPPERDIVFLVDTSVSMQLKDYALEDKPVKRMDLLRNLLNEFATKMAGEHLSVIVFAEQPFMLVPLTNDQNLIRRMLSRITTSLAGRYTAVGDALLMALKEANKQVERHQTFIVFTDADESRGKVTPVAAAKLVAESHIPIYTIAIGSSQKKDDKKVLGGLYQAVNLPLLKQIAEISGGKSYQVNDSEAMKQALQSVLKQRQNLAKPVAQYERKILYIYPLLFGLLSLVFLQGIRLLSQRGDLR